MIKHKYYSVINKKYHHYNKTQQRKVKILQLMNIEKRKEGQSFTLGLLGDYSDDEIDSLIEENTYSFRKEFYEANDLNWCDRFGEYEQDTITVCSY